MQAKGNTTLIIPNAEIIKAALERAQDNNLLGERRVPENRRASAEIFKAKDPSVGARRNTVIQGL